MHRPAQDLENIKACSEEEVIPYFKKIQKSSYNNHLKVLNAFRRQNISDFCFHGTTGYGYGDIGREKLDDLYADIFKAEAALVRAHFVSGTHAIVKAIFGVVRPGEEVLSVTGPPYDTLKYALGLSEKTPGSLSEWGVAYREVPLKNDGYPNLELINENIRPTTKVAFLQRSKGYQERPSLTIDDLGRIIQSIKLINPNIICLVDNCYGEFVEETEPIEAGADLIAGSLIKNPGGSLAPSGGYVAGKEKLVSQVASCLTAPGLGGSVGASLLDLRLLYQGLFWAPHVVAESLKGAIFTSCLYSRLGFEVNPAFSETRTDIVQGIKLNSEERLRAFCKYIQEASPIDSNVAPEPAPLPGYSDSVIMAAGTFVQGSSIELSADGPLKDPYWVYLQGGLSYEYIKYAVLSTAEKLLT